MKSHLKGIAYFAFLGLLTGCSSSEVETSLPLKKPSAESNKSTKLTSHQYSSISPQTPSNVSIAAEQAEAQRLEAERIEAEQLPPLKQRPSASLLKSRSPTALALQAEQQRIEAEQAEAQRLEAERIEAEQLAAAQAEAQRIAAEKAEAQRLLALRRTTAHRG